MSEGLSILCTVPFLLLPSERQPSHLLLMDMPHLLSVSVLCVSRLCLCHLRNEIGQPVGL